MTDTRTCPSCEAVLEHRFRFCPWCGAAQRRKLTAFFAGHRSVADSEGRALRVSRYLTGEITQARVSLWSAEGMAEAVISLDDEEARRLGRFLLEGASPETVTPDAAHRDTLPLT